MRLVSRQALAHEAPRRWAEQYSNTKNKGHQKIRIELMSLAAEKITPEAINAVIGNQSWTRVTCDECGAEPECVVEIGQEPDYESSTAHVCLDCLQSAVALLAPHHR